MKNRWLDDVRVIVFGPSEKLAVYGAQVQLKLSELQTAGIDVLECRACADSMNITDVLEEAGIKVVYVGPAISNLLKDGWISLTY